MPTQPTLFTKNVGIAQLCLLIVSQSPKHKTTQTNPLSNSRASSITKQATPLHLDCTGGFGIFMHPTKQSLLDHVPTCMLLKCNTWLSRQRVPKSHTVLQAWAPKVCCVCSLVLIEWKILLTSKSAAHSVFGPIWQSWPKPHNSHTGCLQTGLSAH